jgi:hypothetical protein
MDQLEKAVRINQAEQQKMKKRDYTKPELFLQIERFIREKKLIGYGGTAINHALPKEFHFYQSSDIPDYDFFSMNAIQDIRELADKLSYSFPNIEVKPAIFQGTYKLFVNYVALVDISQIENELYHHLWTSSFCRDKIHYVPYNYLRMSIHQELSRPLGDVSRWTKIFQRLNLLNTHQPFLIRKCEVKPIRNTPSPWMKKISSRLKSFVLLGDYAMNYWQELFPESYRYPPQDVFMVLSETIEEIWSALKGLPIKYTYYENKLTKVYEIYVDQVPLVYVILSDSCLNYNVYKRRKIASYDTVLSLYFALAYIDIKHLSKQRLLSYCYLLTQIKETDHPLMRRFSLPCYGKQQTLEEIRKQREQLFLKKKHSSYFFHYRPKGPIRSKSGSKSKKKLTMKKRIPS